jgi:hypothetical protein
MKISLSKTTVLLFITTLGLLGFTNPALADKYVHKQSGRCMNI